MSEPNYLNGTKPISIINNLKHKIIYSLFFGFFVFIAITVFADIDAIFSSLLLFEWKYIPLIMALVFLNYLFRYYKWNFYLSILEIDINKKDSAIIFFSGLTMSVTPGKFGEVLKSYLIKQLVGINMSKTAPIIFAERLTDIIGLVFLSSIGSVVFLQGKFILILTIFITSLFVVIIQSRQISLGLIGFGEKLPFIHKFSCHLHELYESIFILLKFRYLFFGIIISIISWFFECLAMWYVLKGFGFEKSILFASFVFSFSSLAGAISMLPGGLGIAEGSIVGILYSFGLPKATAAGSALIIRFFTLWYGVIIGFVALMLFQNKCLKQVNIGNKE